MHMNNETDDKDDSELFRQSLGDVTPLKPDNRIRHKPAPKQPVKQRTDEDTAAWHDRFGRGMIDEEECPETLSFIRPGGAQKSVLKKLRTGKLPIENVLDLHGLNVDQASSELAIFLDECQQLEFRHVIIVHGKGFRSQNKPVIKPMVNRWLKQAQEVLAFHSALPKDGGTGAVYVLLRKGGARDN